MIKGAILNLYLPNNVDAKYIKEKLQEERDKTTTTVGKFSTSFHRINKWKVRKHKAYFNITIDKLDLRDL